MRIVAIADVALLLAACATTPEEPGPAPVPRGEEERETGRLVGLDARELTTRLGRPTLEVREGPGLKLQYRGGGCILDAYLYPPENGRGIERVTHVEARRPSGDSSDVGSCQAAIERAR